MIYHRARIEHLPCQMWQSIDNESETIVAGYEKSVKFTVHFTLYGFTFTASPELAVHIDLADWIIQLLTNNK